MNLEKSLLECQSNAALEVKRLTSEIIESRRAEICARDEVLSVRDERDKLNEKCRLLQAEKDLSAVRSENATRDLELLRVANSSAQASCSEYEQRLLTLQQEVITATQVAASRERDAADRYEVAERQTARIVDLGSFVLDVLSVVVIVRRRCDFLFNSHAALMAHNIHHANTIFPMYIAAYP